MPRREWSGNQGRGLWDNVPIPAEEERRIQAGIDATMREVISRPYNPQALDPPEKVVPIDAPTVVVANAAPKDRGWYTPKSLAGGSRRTDEIIEKLVDAFEPHGEGSVLRKGEGK
jgi:hypothetical protein